MTAKLRVHTPASIIVDDKMNHIENLPRNQQYKPWSLTIFQQDKPYWESYNLSIDENELYWK